MPEGWRLDDPPHACVVVERPAGEDALGAVVPDLFRRDGERGTVIVLAVADVFLALEEDKGVILPYAFLGGSGADGLGEQLAHFGALLAVLATRGQIVRMTIARMRGERQLVALAVQVHRFQ